MIDYKENEKMIDYEENYKEESNKISTIIKEMIEENYKEESNEPSNIIIEMVEEESNKTSTIIKGIIIIFIGIGLIGLRSIFLSEFYGSTILPLVGIITHLSIISFCIYKIRTWLFDFEKGCTRKEIAQNLSKKGISNEEIAEVLGLPEYIIEEFLAKKHIKLSFIIVLLSVILPLIFTSHFNRNNVYTIKILFDLLFTIWNICILILFFRMVIYLPRNFIIHYGFPKEKIAQNLYQKGISIQEISKLLLLSEATINKYIAKIIYTTINI